VPRGARGTPDIRIFSDGMKNKYFAIRRSGVHGKGAFALKDIRKNTRLVEYVGENISPAESDRRYDDTKVKDHHTFLFSVDNRKVIDATYDGNESRFINHSCDPNCDAIIEKRRVYIEANRTIRKGEELAYDYNYERTPKTTKADEKLYKCLCGSENCRGTIVSAKVTLPKKKAKTKTRAKKKSAGKTKTSASKKKGASRKKTGRGR
jgi:hypothetical protein